MILVAGWIAGVVAKRLGVSMLVGFVSVGLSTFIGLIVGALAGYFGGVVDLVGLVGYYTLVSMTLNVFEVGLPDGEAELLD